MAFSQQTYQGQGIVQPTERSRVGELLGAGIAGFGASLGEGIRKFSERKEEMKRREQFKRGTVEALTALGADKDLLKGMEASELAAYAQMYPQIAAQREKEEAQGFYSDMLRAFQPQQVQKDFGPEITAAEQRLIQAQQAGFRPEFTFPQPEAQMPQGAERFRQEPPQEEVVPPKILGAYPYAQELTKFASDTQKAGARFGGLGGFGGAGFYSAPSRFKAPTQDTAGTSRTPLADVIESEMPASMRGIQLFTSDQSRAAMMKRRPTETPTPQAPQPAAAAPTPQVDSQPSQRPSTPMGPEPALEPSPEVQQAARDLDILRIQAAEGDTRLETSKEVMKRVSENIPELAEKYPTQAKNLYEMLYPKQDKLTPSDKISLMKLEREIGASTVTGYGVAPSPEIAKDFREVLISATEAQTGIKRLLEINAMDSPWASIDLRSEAQVLQGTLQGALRKEIVGPGAVTDTEQELLKSIIRDPTKFWSLSSSNKTALETLLKKVERGLAKNAALISWQQPSGMQSGQAQGPMGKTFTYGMSGQLESR